MSGMLATFRNAFKIPELRAKLIFTLIILVLFRKALLPIVVTFGKLTLIRSVLPWKALLPIVVTSEKLTFVRLVLP